jgi:hypothetical protein
MTESVSANPNQSYVTRDLVQSNLSWLLWGVPLVLMAAGSFWAEGRVWLWMPALVVAGAACLVNAARSHRLHCYLTGPFFLLGAVVTVLRATEVLHVSWSLISGGLILGCILAFVPERTRGKYLGTQTEGEGPGPKCC